MEEILGLDSIMSENDAENLFDDSGEDIQIEQKDTGTEPDKTEKENDNPAEGEEEEINEGELFGNSESVGKGEDNNKDGKQPSSSEGGNSQQNNFYSSITQALKDEGIFPDLEDDEIKDTVDPKKFRELFDKQVQNALDARQQRVDRALNVGMEPDDIKKFENTLGMLSNISEQQPAAEGEEGDNLRKQLIYQDFINRGYSRERAIKEVNKSFSAGTEMEDAKEALQANMQYFGGLYQQKVEEAEAAQKELQEENQRQAEELRKSIVEDEKVFGDLVVDKATRKKIFDNISRPVYRDPETGEFLTAIQRYDRENHTEFLKNVSLVYTLTDGFKNFDGLIGKKVRKEVSKGFRDLERKINTTQRNPDGSLKLVSGVSDEDTKLSTFGKDWDLAL
jgi:hypothetical protein